MIKINLLESVTDRPAGVAFVEDRVSSTRTQTLSPNIVGKMLTRMSTRWPPMFSSMRPSCGRRRSAMSRLAMTLIRLEMAVPRWRGGGTIS